MTQLVLNRTFVLNVINIPSATPRVKKEAGSTLLGAGGLRQRLVEVNRSGLSDACKGPRSSRWKCVSTWSSMKEGRADLFTFQQIGSSHDLGGDMADELVKLLNSIGYQPVFLQKTGVKPPDLYQFVDKRLIRRGPLQDYNQEFGKLEKSRGTLPNIQHRESSKKNLDAAVDFLHNALAALGITAIPKLSLSFVGDAELVFTFSEVSYVAVDPTKIDTILQELQVPLAIPDNYVSEGLLHIAYEYAYARRLLMSRADGREFKTDVSGKVGDFIDVGAEGEIDTDGATVMAFKSKRSEAAAFAFKAGKLERSDGRWTFQPEVVRRDIKGGTKPLLLARGLVLTVEEEPAPRPVRATQTTQVA